MYQKPLAKNTAIYCHDLFKFKEFIMFITSFTRGGSMKIDGLLYFEEIVQMLPRHSC